jgi:hypothetical protein
VSALLSALGPVFGNKHGGWWVLTGIQLQLGPHRSQPDLAGWQRERFTPSAALTVTTAPDWSCQVLTSQSHARDVLRHLAQCHAAGVRHSWIVDPVEGALHVFRHDTHGFMNILTAGGTQRVRAEPFEAVELSVATLLGADSD